MVENSKRDGKGAMESQNPVYCVVCALSLTLSLSRSVGGLVLRWKLYWHSQQRILYALHNATDEDWGQHSELENISETRTNCKTHRHVHRERSKGTEKLKTITNTIHLKQLNVLFTFHHLYNIRSLRTTLENIHLKFAEARLTCLDCVWILLKNKKLK